MGIAKTGLTLQTWARLAVLCGLGLLMVVASPSIASANCEPVYEYHYVYYCDAAHTQIVGAYNFNCDQSESSWGQFTEYYSYSFNYCYCIEG